MNRTNRNRVPIRWLVGSFTLLLAVTAWAADNASRKSQDDSASPDSLATREDGQYVLREGTKVKDILGTFRISGDRAEFTMDKDKLTYGGLENLALERIVQTTADNQVLLWSVSGQLRSTKEGISF